MPQYRVKAGPSPFGGHEPGTIVNLTVEEAAGFRDKLEFVSDDVEAPAVDERPTAPPLKNELGIQVPDEMKFVPAKRIKKKKAGE